jgi:hypothetical protein
MRIEKMDKRESDLVKIINSKDHKDGIWTLRDVRGDPRWHPVQGVEDHRSHSGELRTVINHLDYEQAAKKYL